MPAHGGLEVGVDLHAAALVGLHAELLEAEALHVAFAPTGVEQRVGTEGLGADVHEQAVRRRG